MNEEAAECAATGDARMAMFWNGQLSSILSKQGRSNDAVVLQEAFLKHMPRLVPENDPNIGTANICSRFIVLLSWMLTLAALGMAMSNLAVTYSDLGRHQDALAMEEKTLEFRRRVLPPNHPDIGAT